MLRYIASLSVGLLLQSADLSAQEPFNIAGRVDRLATLFTQLYGRDGLIVDSRATLPTEEDHAAHFDSAFQSEFVLSLARSQICHQTAVAGGLLAMLVSSRDQ